MKRFLMWSLTGLLVLVAAAQLVPYGRDHDNPPVAAEPTWDTPTTRELARRACFDCHSNETQWPWYSNIAPLSWLIQRDVEEGRD
jgi:mono/diheme cytochrome c family protein